MLKPWVFFCPLEPVLEHLSKCQSFVLKHSSSGPSVTLSDSDILTAIRNIDETIRAEWARVIRLNQPE
eukprot:4364398-Karenia_brevis.AAC.1